MSNNHCQISRWQLLKQQLQNLDPEQFGRSIARTCDAVILDVRTPAEFQEGALPGAINLNYLGEDFLDQLERLDREKTYFVYCRTSRRSVRTCILMKNSGFDKLFNLENGWAGWKEFYGI